MKKFIVIFVLLWTSLFTTRADEGMWLPLFIDRLNYTDLQRMGLKLTPEEIYSVNSSSLKDAIVQFGRGCTGEIISAQGLLLTNHHCGYGAIQSLSSVETDYLTNGFWAYSLKEELPVEGLTVRFLIRIEDVTKDLLNQLEGIRDETERNKKLREISGKIEKEATHGTTYEASVRGFYEGNEYYLFVYEIYNDVRLAGAPPSSIGKFGGETDNWMWPRHTGDFALFRVYAGPDGKPAAYSDKNVPITPKHFLPINIGGYKRSDFAMILGYPGTTERYLTSHGIEQYMQVTYPTRIDIRAKKLQIIGQDMKADDAVRIKYASKYAGISNYWKNFIGVMKAVNRLKITDKKLDTEKELLQWANSTAATKEKYGQMFNIIEAAYKHNEKYLVARLHYIEAVFGCEAMAFSRHFKSLEDLLAASPQDKQAIDKKTAELKSLAARFFKDYDAETDRKLTQTLLAMYYKNVPRDQQPAFLLSTGDKARGDFGKYTDAAFAKSVFISQTKTETFLASPSLKNLQKDPLYKAMTAFMDIQKTVSDGLAKGSNDLAYGRRLLVAAMREMTPAKQFYPDANGTMRLTYGTVLDYIPADGVRYDYATTLDGVFEKEDPNDPEFMVPAKLKELWEKKDYGDYAEKGQLYTCFLTDNDITGGNSGSPVLNGKGELIGLAFDGNWESMSGNILFEPEVQRTINVDIRYVLFIIDKFAGAKNLIAEMKIVK